MKIVIIGGVAAGTKTAAKLKRECPNDEIVIYTKAEDISYAGCGLPYYVGGVIAEKEQLIVNTPEAFMRLTGTQVYTNCEVTALNPTAKTIVVGNETVSYDRLVIAVGAKPIVPNINGVELEGVFCMRTPKDAIALRDYQTAKQVKKAVVVGAGFIGLEIAENLMAQGVSVTLLDMASQLLPNVMDEEMAAYLRRKLQDQGMRILTGTAVEEILGDTRVQSVVCNNATIPADMVVLAVGIQPATEFLNNSGLAMEKGCIITDEKHRTNLADIYAVGDCALVSNRLTKKRQWSAMGSTANITGRNLALAMSGEGQSYPGSLGTGVVRLGEHLNAARVGLGEAQAQALGFDVISVISANDDKAHYYPDSDTFYTKLIADRTTHQLLGMQVIGSGAVDKMADIAVTAISLKACLEDLIMMDFAYAPPFSTAIHPFATACGVLLNKISARLESITALEYAQGKAKDYTLIDAYSTPTLTGAEWFDVNNLAACVAHHDRSEKLLLVCARGKRAYLLQNKLKAMGFQQTRVLEAGASFNVIKRTLPAGAKLSADEIKRVKGLGCLQDKRFPDVFNVRVITRNGKISADEHRAVAEAAEQFGSGEVTMTSRLTLEIQGVRYEQIDPLIAFLQERGLETGGTGSLVRPVVSCKGTTCQYGLIDTFGLSEKIHERFYKGYHHVTLPHKFKIAVGGCPNNCIKPDLNDLGIIGQRIPLFDFAKCRGCLKCQVAEACPIKIATLSDGKLNVDQTACNGCGRCKEKCPFGVSEEYRNGYKVFIGGRWGKKMANGIALNKLFTSEEEVLDIIERAILFFRDEGISGERFADTVNRLGFAYVEDRLLNQSIDKEAILQKQVKGGAKC
ncbi:MAG: FAD-dependent oxidoreductase [Erysipelotrichaceae bacterium]|nr:FAD-dependent oxidoreductase [Erysipelotrichaceae bacterium]